MNEPWAYPGDVYEIIRAYHRKLSTEISFLESYGLQAPCRMLDVGCATGVLMRAFAEKGVLCTGVDPSSTFINYAQLENSKKGLGGTIKLINQRLQDFSYLESYEQVEDALAKLKFSLKKGGKLVLEFAYYLNFVSGFLESMVVNHFEDDIKISRTIRHSVNPHRATWLHQETMLVQREGAPLETYFESQPQIVLLPPTIRQMLTRVGFGKVDFWATWDKGRQIVGHSTCIVVAE
jgi:SAM-dependent methyltransferase